MKIKNEIKIEVNFPKKSKRKTIFKGKADYKFSKGNQDEIEIYTDLIKITAKRSSKIDIKSILKNPKNTIHTNLIKSLILHYLSNNEHKILKIEISNGKNIETIPGKQIKQPLLSKVSWPIKIRNDLGTILFEENIKSTVILNSLSHMISAMNHNDPFPKFEKLWKSFNILFMHIGGKTKEFESMKEFKIYLMKNESKFNFTKNITIPFNAYELRSRMKIKEMIFNNYSPDTKLKGYSDMIQRYKNKKICSLLLETLVYKEAKLKLLHLYNDAKTHLDKYSVNGNDDEIEVTSFISLIYLYFIRNKLFHGERLDPTFQILDNQEKDEMEWNCQFLTLLNFETINQI
ncbi:hypothetical protein [Leptospira sp. 'Mane']|uniref:hypothetical protein n=1 Tax=Leptospira sp. 'Mane' TaxID=3387407 RepID=UPI00398B3599